ncbi:MAG TPA: phospholipid carrier-dependent glycosyltransferase [Gemmatimonadaceae bacterium]|nr:phospholipid carrier-dependent glycosyltransferase [Gemmatimonadaceae bacterium]
MSERRVLAALILLFSLLLFFELPGSWLIEPDEARYAEIPREMLATRDFVTPRLDSAHYFEKPPLLYWANAASMAVLGQSAFAARLPTRIAGLATAAMLILAFGVGEAEPWGLWAALIFLTAPLSWVLSRYNTTDAVLTFGMTLSFLALRAFLVRREAGKGATGMLALLGAGVALATLAKGLIGIALPGLVFLIWMALTGRWRRLPELLLSPAPVVLLLLAVPWFVLVERANPGFSRIFFIREHFARFATPEASRPGPIYYFVAVFVAGFLPWTFVCHRAIAPLRDAWRARVRSWSDELFLALWFGVILVFFSVSHSKLIPYILPAFPAAAALAARGVLREAGTFRRPLWWHAWLVTAMGVGGVTYGVRSGTFAHYAVTGIACAGTVVMLVLAWLAVWRARVMGRRALFPAALAWGALYLMLILAMPHVADELSGHDVAVAARAAHAERVVSYKCYPQLVPWVLHHPIVVADFTDELGSDGVRPPSLFWSGTEFWRRWRSGEPMVVVVKRRTLHELADSSAFTTLAGNRKYVVVSNVAAPMGRGH